MIYKLQFVKKDIYVFIYYSLQKAFLFQSYKPTFHHCYRQFAISDYVQYMEVLFSFIEPTKLTINHV